MFTDLTINILFTKLVDP